MIAADGSLTEASRQRSHTFMGVTPSSRISRSMESGSRSASAGMRALVEPYWRSTFTPESANP